MKIIETKFYDGSHDKVFRLGLSNVFLELLESLIEVKIYLKEEKNANGAAIIGNAIKQVGIYKRVYEKIKRMTSVEGYMWMGVVTIPASHYYLSDLSNSLLRKVN